MNPRMLRKGQEQAEEFYSYLAKAKRIQYEYRSMRGPLFDCTARSLEEAHQKRDAWLKEKGWAA